MTKWQTFFTHPMRPFFIGSALVAILGGFTFFISNNFVLLHRLLFLEIVLPMAYGGFLQAAMLEWTTSFTGGLKKIGLPMFVLLLIALVMLPFLPTISAYLVAVYWLILLIFCTYLLWIDKNTDNFALLLLLACFVGFQTAYAYTGDWTLLRSQVHLNMAAIMFVSFRVSLLLGNEALKECRLKDPVFIPNVVYKNIAVTLLLIYALAELFAPLPTVGFLALAVGMILLAKLREWHHMELLRKHYVRTYYWLQLLGALGYLWLGWAQLAGGLASTPLHLITLAGLLGALFVVFMTAGLWHSGFTKLDYPKIGRIAVAGIFLTAIVRTWLMPLHSVFYITLPALMLIGVFILYLIMFLPIFSNNAFTDDPE